MPAPDRHQQLGGAGHAAASAWILPPEGLRVDMETFIIKTGFLSRFLQGPYHYHGSKKRVKGVNIGVAKVRLGSWGILYYNCRKTIMERECLFRILNGLLLGFKLNQGLGFVVQGWWPLQFQCCVCGIEPRMKEQDALRLFPNCRNPKPSNAQPTLRSSNRKPLR